jgi:hypothetical protein
MPTAAGSQGVGQFGMGLQIAGALSSAIGSYASARAQKSQLRMQAILDGINAKAADSSADATLAAGQHEEQASMLRTAQLKSTQQADFAAGNIDLGEGSAARVLTSTDVMGAIDKNTIAANAVRQAWGYRTGAVNDRNQGVFASAAADSINPTVGGATSLLGSAGSVAQNWYQLNKSGAFGAPGANGIDMLIAPGQNQPAND